LNYDSIQGSSYLILTHVSIQLTPNVLLLFIGGIHYV